LTYFDHEDTLGTQRIRTNYAGWTASSYLSLPWGDGYAATVNNAGGDQDNLHFAGLERDAESGTEHAQFRNYASAQGRWLAPDPYLGSYDVTNPQSMNRYAYALNNPTSLVDPSGLDPTCSIDPETGNLECTSYYPTDPTDPGPCGWDPSFCGGGWECQEYGCGATGGGNNGGGSGGSGPSYGPPYLATLSAPINGQQQTSFKNCATQKLKPQLNANLNTWLGQLKKAPLVGVAGATAVTGAIVIAEPETLPVAPALFVVLAANITVTAADISTTYAAAKSILQIGGAAITCGAQAF
jgi:RHS repeat-associated protein